MPARALAWLRSSEKPLIVSDLSSLVLGDEFYVDFVYFRVVVKGVDGQVVDGIDVGVNEFKAEFVGVGVCGCKLHG